MKAENCNNRRIKVSEIEGCPDFEIELKYVGDGNVYKAVVLDNRSNDCEGVE